MTTETRYFRYATWDSYKFVLNEVKKLLTSQGDTCYEKELTSASGGGGLEAVPI